MPDTLIRRVGEITGWSHEEMAKRIGMDGVHRRQTVAAWANGKQEPRPKVYGDLAEALTKLRDEIEAILPEIERAVDQP